jgi:signal transduction histidine kinase
MICYSALRSLRGVKTRVHNRFAQRTATAVHIRRICATAALIVFLAASLGCSAGIAAESKRVMLLHSFGSDFKPWSEYAKSIRTELKQQSPWPLDITEHSLVTARSPDEDPEAPFVEYLRALFAKRPLDLIVSIGAPAAAFVQRHRHRLFAATPMVFTAVDQRRVQYSSLTANDAVVALRIDYLSAFENILQVLPDTKNVIVVVGTSPIEKFWKEAIGKEVEPLANRIKLSWTDELSFEALLKQASALPPHTAIFWELMIVDAAGVVHEGDVPLTRLHAVANAPIFSYDESFFGNAIVGGPLLLAADTGRQTAAVAIRILNGEKPGEIRAPVVQFASPVFDWREMQRWGISKNSLPSGSEILFRSPTAWEQYRGYILAFFAAILIQSALILWLVYEHWRRQRAEILARNTMSELAHVNRVATVGELSASIAHEVRQPLAAMLANAEGALRWLKKGKLEEVRAGLKDIVSEGFRANDIITNLRAMFKHDVQEKTLVDINKLVSSVLALVVIDLQKHEIELQTQLDEQIPQVLGNQVQLQQVILNLVMNAIEAMSSSQIRALRIKTALSQFNKVHVSVEDTGAGIKPSDVDRLFKPLFTTKARGMGMGLSICQSIVETHGGRIWVSPGANGGSIFQFELPMAARKEQAA